MTPAQVKLLFRVLWVILRCVRLGSNPSEYYTPTTAQIERDLKEEGGL